MTKGRWFRFLHNYYRMLSFMKSLKLVLWHLNEMRTQDNAFSASISRKFFPGVNNLKKQILGSMTKHFCKSYLCKSKECRIKDFFLQKKANHTEHPSLFHQDCQFVIALLTHPSSCSNKFKYFRPRSLKICRMSLNLTSQNERQGVDKIFCRGLKQHSPLRRMTCRQKELF